MQRRNYAWSPFCKKQARECGGYDKKKCDVYGAHGSDRDSRPSDEQLTQAMQWAVPQTQVALGSTGPMSPCPLGSAGPCPLGSTGTPGPLGPLPCLCHASTMPLPTCW